MAETSFPFDSGPGATITEDQWSRLASPWQADGVVAPGTWDNALQVTSANENLTIHVAAGHGVVSGFHYQLDTAKTMTIAANVSATPRIDRVVLKLDRVTNTIAFLYKQGVPATSPVPPSIDKSWASPEVAIAAFTVRANASAVLPAEVVDEREFIGRYVRVTESPAAQVQGTISYRPSTQTFHAAKAGGAVEQFAYKAAMDSADQANAAALAGHVAAADPHPQYFTLAEGNANFRPQAINNGLNLTNGNFTVFRLDYRGIKWPGTNFGIIHLTGHLKYNGSTTNSQTQIAEVLNYDAPWYDHRFNGVQYLFTNSTDDIPLILWINSGGQIATSGDTTLMGGAYVNFSTTWVTGANG